MFYLYHHNNLGHLAELFGALRLRRQRSPLAVDTVLVPNAGIGRWLRIQLAESEGVVANVHERLPGEFIWALVRTIMAGGASGDHFESDCLPWHLYQALPVIADEIPAIADYIGAPSDEIRRYQLARRLADVFDQYLVYRADMLARWEAGETPPEPPGCWQAPVWRWLTRSDRLGGHHRARVLTDFIKGLATDRELQQLVIQRCPDPLYCFGLAVVAPDHLRLLYALAAHVDVHFMLPNPSAAYWGDVTGARTSLDRPGDENAAPLPGEAYVDTAHPLLASLGRTARDTLRILYADEFSAMIEPELGALMAYQTPGDATLLHRIQTDIVNLDCQNPTQGMADDDTSFEVHACHSALREVQVLQDQLLDRLATDDRRTAAGQIDAEARLAPRDIVVMLPDVAAYAPAIQAVFGGAAADRYLPFGLADRARAAVHPIVACVSSLLDLPLSRWAASDMLDLLAVPAVMRRFGLSTGELEVVTEWVEAAGIRWGRDAAHRAALGAGRFGQNSWQFGLDRLLLGVAQSEDETLIDGVAPWADLEGGETAALGKLWRFERTLTRLAEALAEPATPGVWQTRLNHLLDALLAPAADTPDEQRAVASLRSVFARLETAERCTADKPLAADRRLSWAAVRDAVRAELATVAERQPFLGGGITFCGLVPLRAVPFRVVCVLGVNDGAFPRQETGRGFNVMHDQPRLGDRNARDDDRLLFLQALTAARDAVHISYVGQDMRTGDERPPSPIVGETLAFLHRHYFATWSSQAFNDRLIHRQPMQPFSMRYFSRAETDPRVFTFGRDWRDATRAAAGARRQPAPLLDETRAPLPEPIAALDLATLKRFFDHPPRAFFRERLKLDLARADERGADEEPIALDALARSGLRSRLFETAVRADCDALETAPSDLERARGTLPPPPLADWEYAQAAADINTVLPVWRTWQAESPTPETVAIDLTINGVRVTGRVDQLWPGALRRLRTGKLRTRFKLRYWLDYLAVVAAGREVALELAGFAGQKDATEFVHYAGRLDAERARAELARLLRLYIDGQQRPLAFHPDLADEYRPDQTKAFANLSYRFKSGAYSPHHLMRDPYVTMLLGDDAAPLGQSENDSAFIQAIDTVTATLSATLRAVPTHG